MNKFVEKRFLFVKYVYAYFIRTNYFCLTDGEICQVMGGPSNKTGELHSNTENSLLDCPGPEDPSNHTACCYDYDDQDQDYRDVPDGSADGSGHDDAYEDDKREPAAKIRRPRCCPPKPQPINFLDWILSLDPR